MPDTNRKDEVLQTLTEGIARLASSDRWAEWLAVQSRFHRYSFGNTLLILMQRPDATRVAGFKAWQGMDRQVAKGEKAIWILAPVTRKASDVDPEVHPGTPDDKRRVLVAFKPACVFDIAQTYGEELPTVCDRLDGDDPVGHYAQLLAFAQSIGFSVEDHEFGGGTNGDCSHIEHRIRVESRNSPLQRIKTLAHEIAHALLHESYDNRALAELEAESTAFVICQSLGLDTSDYSFGYVANWAGGGDEAIAGIKASGERIQRAAATVLQAVETNEEAAA